jgi:hypothetical protein
MSLYLPVPSDVYPVISGISLVTVRSLARYDASHGDSDDNSG